MRAIILRALAVLALAIAAVAQWHGDVMALLSAPFALVIEASRPLGVAGPMCGCVAPAFAAPHSYFASMLAAYPFAILGLRGLGRIPTVALTQIEKLRSMLLIGVLPFVASAGLVYALVVVAARLYMPGATHLFGAAIISSDLPHTARSLANIALLLMLPTALFVQIAAWKIALRRRRTSA